MASPWIDGGEGADREELLDFLLEVLRSSERDCTQLVTKRLCITGFDCVYNHRSAAKIGRRNSEGVEVAAYNADLTSTKGLKDG